MLPRVFATPARLLLPVTAAVICSAAVRTFAQSPVAPSASPGSTSPPNIIERDSGVDPLVVAPTPSGPQRFEERGLDVEEKVGNYLPMELQFTDDTGKLVSLSRYFSDADKAAKRPAVIVMAYYTCPVVCKELVSKLVRTLNGVDYLPGKDYNLLVFSFNPKEHVAAAKEAKLVYSTQFRDDDAAKAGFHFHVGTDLSSRSLAEALGFRYKYLPDVGEYSHPVVTFLATPDGKISRYLYGYEQEPRDMRLALMEASDGKLVRTVGERLMNFCYMYDPTRGTYTLQAVRVMQLGAVLSMVLLGSLVGGLLLAERLRKRRVANQSNNLPGPPTASSPSAPVPS